MTIDGKPMTNEEIEGYCEFAKNILQEILEYADDHCIDRDSFFKAFLTEMSAIGEISTFKNYDLYGGDTE